MITFSLSLARNPSPRGRVLKEMPRRERGKVVGDMTSTQRGLRDRDANPCVTRRLVTSLGYAHRPLRRRTIGTSRHQSSSVVRTR
jgi:hypothetical protein